MEFYGHSRRPFFIEEDDGLASLTTMEAGYSGSHYQVHIQNGYARFFYGRFEDHQPHFLDACFLCKKSLRGNRDIFMNRGDTPFCSEECRQEQIDMDEAKENNWNLSSSAKALREKDQRQPTSPTKSQDYPFLTGTVAAA
ncbi:poly(U)-specific endoribonuclease-B-like [Hibiscus syriacus]|uniref:Poly(U)-specific endoribonuclease-B-like n=1 Tax=Hibiscus syriacus TaxID=106335 RepID=A0A6A3CXA2_HIBSY|nr:poly(U)-specific endoribonuclease-B-like [Hibiscus syriacus]